MLREQPGRTRAYKHRRARNQLETGGYTFLLPWHKTFCAARVGSHQEEYPRRSGDWEDHRVRLPLVRTDRCSQEEGWRVSKVRRVQWVERPHRARELAIAKHRGVAGAHGWTFMVLGL